MSDILRPMFYNAVDFSSLFTRESQFYNTKLQRVKNLIAPIAGVLSFEFVPGLMPESVPDCTLTANLSNGTYVEIDQTVVYTLTDRYVYLFNVSAIGLISGNCDFSVTVAGYSNVIYSEKCYCYALADFPENNLVRLIAYNSDMTRGWISSSYPAFGVFQVSDLNGQLYGTKKTVYEYGYGRVLNLGSESHVKSILAFQKLSLYQQNLLKFLCDCETLSINGTTYALKGELKEENKDPQNEICDLLGEFVPVVQSFSLPGATSKASELEIKNLFI